MIDATAVEHPPVARPKAGLTPVLGHCPLCGEYEAEPVAVGNDLAHGTTPESFLAGSCRGCGLVYLNPRPPAEERSRLYPPAYFSSSEAGGPTGSRWARAVARRALRCCGAIPANAQLLEVGYGARLHLAELREADPGTWRLEAVTPYEGLARSAREGGSIVYQGRTSVLKELGASYDVVFLLHALEHCESPLEELSSLRRLLRPGGRLVILTQNVDSAVGRLFRGRHWAGYDFPRHLSLFGPNTIRRLAAEAGFEINGIGTLGNARAWVHSAANLLRDWHAPSWLTNRVDRGALPFGGLAMIAEGASQFRGKGASLAAVLRKPEETGG
jgi:SAM-dependent methyltransferase